MNAQSRTPLRDLFRSTFAHDRWATTRILEALEPLAAPTPAAGEAANKIAHIVAAHEVWEARLRGVAFAGELLPERIDLNDVAQRFQAVSHRLADFIEAADEPRFLEEIAYRSTEGAAYTSIVRDVLLHVTHHAMYHRGQAARLLRDDLARPIPADYILFTRSDAESI